MRLPEICFSVFVDRQAAAKAAAAIREEAEVAARRRSDRREPRFWRPMKRKPGLAAVKHAQNLAAERTARTEQQGRAFVALAHVVAAAGGGGWPETMTRELHAAERRRSATLGR